MGRALLKLYIILTLSCYVLAAMELIEFNVNNWTRIGFVLAIGFLTVSESIEKQNKE